MFYITPPSGNIRLEKFHHAAISRVNFLVDKFVKCSTNGDKSSDANYDVSWLVEGTPKDTVSHFLLRLACCDDVDLANAFVDLEKQLFLKRIYALKSADVKQLSRIVRGARNEVGEIVGWNPKSGGFGDRHYDVYCRLYVAFGAFVGAWRSSTPVAVPFDAVTPLVATRGVILSRGDAILSSARDEMAALGCLFELVLSSGVAALKSSKNVLRKRPDERIESVADEIRNALASRLRAKRGREITPLKCKVPVLKLDHVDFLAKTAFPPCMQNLHARLKETHRLKHHGRVQFTLFLKEVGMPFDEAVEFWKREYSKPEVHHCKSSNENGKHSCGHSWQRDSRKYLASLRGLYGKSGSRIDYSAHSCLSLQRTVLSSSSEIGGCAFVHSDDQVLKKYMYDASGNLVSPSDACSNCLAERIPDIEDLTQSRCKIPRKSGGEAPESLSNAFATLSFSKPGQFYAFVRSQIHVPF